MTRPASPFAPISKPSKKPKRRGHRDPVTKELRFRVLFRDGECVMHKLDPDHACYDKWGAAMSHYELDKLELDHLDNAGLGKRGPSHETNLVSLCPQAHALKTNHAKTWRPLLAQYLERLYGDSVVGGE